MTPPPGPLASDAPLVGFRTVPFAATVYRIAGRVMDQQRWRRWALAMALGVVAALALPPVDFVPALVVAFCGLVWLLDGAPSWRAAFLVGWSFGFGFFVAGIYWTAISFLVDIERFWWLTPFAVMGLPAVLGVFTGVATAAAKAVRARGLARILVLAIAWTAGEWLRGHVLTGFPWNLVGYAWSGAFPGSTAVLQTAAVTGIYGLSLLTVLIAALPAAFADPYLGRHRLGHAVPVIAPIVLLALLVAVGAARLSQATGAVQPGVYLRIVQPAIEQTLKFQRGEAERTLNRHLDLSRAPAARPPTHIIWPEASVSYLLNREPRVREVIGSVAPSGGFVLLGAVRANATGETVREVWNSVYVIDRTGDEIARFDKAHLVPFGEYMPLSGILPLKKITAGTIDFSTGPGPQTLNLPGLPPVGPMICYEVIFPGAVVDEANRPDWMLNLTNDAWFGFSSGPFQHFAIARVRAVEEGLPLVRAANNGISGIFDAYGRVTTRLNLDVVGVVDGELPVKLPPTPFSRAGDWILVAMMAVMAAMATGLDARAGRRA